MYSLKKLSVLAAATLVAAAAFVSGCGSNAPAGGTEITNGGYRSGYTRSS